MAKISFPAVAIWLAPKTGEATNEAPFWLNLALTLFEVSG